MPVSIQDCEDYINAHIYENSNGEVSASEVKEAMLKILQAMQSFIPKGEFDSDELALAAGLQIGDTYILSPNNVYGVNKRGVQVTLTN